MGFHLSLQSNIRCMETETQALLSFKQGLLDPYRVLSSWNAGANVDCCDWRGVRCSNNTSSSPHIIGLDLRGSGDECLIGEVGSSLAQLTHLDYLDLSSNKFDRISLQDIGSLINLNYLNLSHNNFATPISPHLGNLSNLSVLDLGSNGWVVDNLRWVSRLSSLKHLDLSLVDLRSNNDWAGIMSKLPVLQRLSLSSCSLPQPVLNPYENTNFSRFLAKLDLSLNYDLNSSIYSWLNNFRNSLTHLDLTRSNLQGFNMDGFENMTSLVFLNLRSTKVDFHSPKWFKNLCNLKLLDLSGNNGGGLLSDVLKLFPQCVINSLETLYLPSNKLFGSLPDFTIFPSLKELELSFNMLNGPIPQSLGQLSTLEHIGLNQNFLVGEVSEAHFSKLVNLKSLNLDGNSLAFNFKEDWVPPFQLQSISLVNCSFSTRFPRWLRTQNFSYLDISLNRISDTIPDWFWKNLSPDLLYLDISLNEIRGEIPDLDLKFNQMPVIILGSNEFEGQVPAFLFGAQNLDVSRNNFTDISGLCEVRYSPLYLLDACANLLSGQLPNCWDKMPNLVSLSLAYNSFSGDIPTSLGSLTTLKFLNLRINNFSGEIPSWFNYTELKVFDASYNNLSGTIPSWIGSRLPNLVRLSLRFNHFQGNLPSSLCNLRNIEVLDISFNSISGSIPTCLHNFDILTGTSNASMVQDQLRDLILMWKGQERLVHGHNLEIQRGIDLSSNHLTGEIPNEITKLVGLVSLNLSRNELTGQIPKEMGQLQSLDFLDLSRNRLYGPIPSSFSQIWRLSMLDVSYNNLSGSIPLGTQLQGFNTSSYAGNPYLCGDPLKKCVSEQTSFNSNVHVVNEYEKEHTLMTQEMLISISVGFIVGLWGIFASLLLNRRWRHAYFKFLTNIIEKLK
ncbi:Receptor-like protein EIX2, partial [Cucurbita argyrosperma subsp. sororia]